MNHVNGKATKTKGTFRMETAVSIGINARPERIWALLTDAGDFPRWNSTIVGIEGRIAPGETIKLRSTSAPQRTFNLKVATFVPNQTLVLQDGRAPMFQGVRRYTIQPQNNGSSVFTMSEAFSGLMLPMIAGSLPDFRPSFEQYAADLKREAERSA